jgi:Ribosomal protein L16/L10E
MLAPKRVKFRKWQKGRLRGLATRGATVAFGDIGLKTVQHGAVNPASKTLRSFRC